MTNIIFYAINTILVFSSLLLLLGIVQLISFLIIKNKKFVDGKTGKIKDASFKESSFKDYESRLDIPTYAVRYVVECKIQDKDYVLTAERLTKKYYLFTPKINNDINKIMNVKYSYSKKNKVKLYIYEEKESIKQILIYSLIGIASILLLILLWSNMDKFLK